MNSIILPGKAIRASCEECGRFTEATFAYGPFEYDGAIVDDVMRATCNVCGQVVSLAPQSSHRLRVAREEKAAKRTSIRVPMELMDFMGLRLSIAGAQTTHVELFIRALLVACDGKEAKIAKALVRLDDPVLQAPNRLTINVNLGPQLLAIVTTLMAESGLTSVSETLRRLIVLSDQKPWNESTTAEVRKLALAYA